jgi:hypothetical protein
MSSNQRPDTLMQDRISQIDVKLGRTQVELNVSAYPPIADMRADIADGSFVPIGNVGSLGQF